MKKITRACAIMLGAALLVIVTLSLDKDNKRFEISKGLDIFATLFREVNLLYVDEVQPEKMVQDGIDAMLKNLDPYTVFYPESRMDEFNMMMTGEYAGIGSIIRKKGDHVIIWEPYKDSPAHKAGLLPGDKILAIDGQEMKGKSVEEVSALLKGQPNKELLLKLERVGGTKPVEKRLVREIVQLPAIPYHGMIGTKTGYIYFTSFTDKAAENLRRVILDLKNRGAESLVLDLRGNGGGLLDQSVEIANFFIPRGLPVVSTRGKVKQWDKEYQTRNNPIVPDMKLAVLIDRASASASEILAGALQDYDRAVIIGERSFGKGLVQTTRDLTYNTKLKVTTAKYHVPSGRCIQALDYSHRNPDGSVGAIPDSLVKPFHTKAGRVVYDGGGISPDVKVEPENYTKLTRELVAKDLVFDFVNEYAVTRPTVPPPASFEVTDEMYNAFKTFLNTREFEYETASQLLLGRLEEAVLAEKYHEQVAGQLEKLKADLGHSIDRDLALFREEIASVLADQFMERYYMQAGVIEYLTRHDRDILKALEILSDEAAYRAILPGPTRPDATPGMDQKN
ncbi:MAG: S41 family peptidase [Odoribacteraceae bacterium]|jgi:carboxyl-terminal processing protease|nr:S41 family peptidase [Odoribacteraceae bacterium]